MRTRTYDVCVGAVGTILSFACGGCAHVLTGNSRFPMPTCGLQISAVIGSFHLKLFRTSRNLTYGKPLTILR